MLTVLAALSLGARAFAREIPAPDLDAPALSDAGARAAKRRGAATAAHRRSPLRHRRCARAPPPPTSEAAESANEGTSKIAKKKGASEAREEAEEEEEFEEVAPRPSAKGDPFGDEPENGPKTKGFTFRLLLQTRYTRVFDDASVKDAESNDGFALNRVFLRGTVHPYKWLSAKLLVDFAELAYSNPQQALKLAYGEIKPMEATRAHGRSLQADLLAARAAPDRRIRVGRHRPHRQPDQGLTQFGGRDVGAMVRGDPLPKRRWLHVYLGAFGGAGEGAEGMPGTTGNVNTGPDLGGAVAAADRAPAVAAGQAPHARRRRRLAPERDHRAIAGLPPQSR